MIRWLWRMLAAIVLVALLALGGGYLWLRTALPELDGRIAASGLRAPVEILRDGDAIVTIRAGNELDAYFALGFAHAQDRLFQMDFMRRLGAGRLSEVVGQATVAVDRWMRVLGLYRLAEANLPLLPAEVQDALAAYSDGVNAFLAQRSGAWPPEFYLLRHRPEPWRPADSLVWGRLMAMHLSDNWLQEFLRWRMAQRLPPDRLESLWPAQPSDGLARQGGAAHGPLFPELAGLPFAGDLPGASNNWVVAGARSATGKPLLANDLHLGLTAPIQWYLARIETPQWRIVGATAPGVPFTLVGHNEKVAWGVTTTHSDTQDLFIERVLPQDPTRYETPAGPQPFRTREERIAVRGAADIVISVRESRHGPVISDAGKADLGLPGQVTTLAWAALRAEDRTAEAVYRMNHAADADDFLAALHAFESPQQNVVYADIEGRIGFVAAGLVPVRKSLFAGSQMPVPGWSGAYDWTGFLPFADLPQSHDPADGWLATANNRIVDEDYPHFIGARWEPPYRFRRIGELLEATRAGTVEDMGRMQTDTVSLAARDLLPGLGNAAGTGNAPTPAATAALRLLRSWDFRMDRDRPEPLIFTAWLSELVRTVFTDELGPLFREYGAWNVEELAELIVDRDGAWCDNIATPAPETCPEQIQGALARAVVLLAAAYGEDPRDWRWGTAHRARFDHPVLAYISVLRDLFDPEIGTPGANDTLSRGTAGRVEDPLAFPHLHGAGLRAVFDLADLDRSRFMIATGQSGHPLSPHYADFISRWRDGGFVTIVGGGDHVLTLTPE